MKPGGRVAVISFHSLEDRVVKHRMKAWAQGLHLPQAHPRVRVPSCAGSPACDPEARLSFRTGAHAQPPRGQRKLRVAEKLDPHARKADEDSGEEAARLRYEAKRAARLARHGREGRERA